MSGLLLVFLACVASAMSATNFTGYIVTGNWYGRTFPTVEWALDVTRQDTVWTPQVSTNLAQLIPTTSGPALAPTYTAYDESSRTYFVTADRNRTGAYMWALSISRDVAAATPLAPQVAYALAEIDAVMVGMVAINIQGTITPIVFYQNGSAYAVDYKTGASRWWLDVVNASRILTTAIQVKNDGSEIYVISESLEGAPDRAVVTITVNTRQTVEVLLAPLKQHDPTKETPFEMVWMPTLNALFVMWFGAFDQLMYVVPTTGATSFATYDLAQFGNEGNFQFTSSDKVEDDDMWMNACIDNVKNKIYFQCTDVNPMTGEETTTLCEIATPKKIGYELSGVNTAISPLGWGYVGFQFVQVIA